MFDFLSFLYNIIMILKKEGTVILMSEAKY